MCESIMCEELKMEGTSSLLTGCKLSQT